MDPISSRAITRVREAALSGLEVFLGADGTDRLAGLTPSTNHLLHAMLEIFAVLDGQLTAQGVVIKGSRPSLLDDVESCQVSARITSIADSIGQSHSPV